MTIIDRYLARILLHGFFSSLGIIGGLLILHRFYRIIELAVTRSLSGFQVVELLLWVLPLILFHTLPIAAIVGTLLTFGRLAADAEIGAMLAAGVGRARIALLPLSFSLLLTGFALYNNLFLMPAAYVRFDSVGFGVGIDPMKALKPGVVERVSGRHIAVNEIDPDRQTFRGLFAVIPSPLEEKSPGRLLLLAASGSWAMGTRSITLDLANGSARDLGTTGPGRVLSFGNYRLLIPLPIDWSPDPKRKSPVELLRQPVRENLAEFARRILSAVVIPLFIACSIPLVARARGGGRKGHARGVVWYAVLLYFLHWILYFAADSLVTTQGFRLAWLALPHAVLAGVATTLWAVTR